VVSELVTVTVVAVLGVMRLAFAVIRWRTAARTRVRVLLHVEIGPWEDGRR